MCVQQVQLEPKLGTAIVKTKLAKGVKYNKTGSPL